MPRVNKERSHAVAIVALRIKERRRETALLAQLKILGHKLQTSQSVNALVCGTVFECLRIVREAVHLF